MPLPGFWKEWKSGGEGGWLLGRVLAPLLSPLFPLLGAGLLLCCVEVAATIGSWRPERPIGCPQPSPWLRLSYGHQLLLSLSWMVEDESKTLPRKGHCQVRLPGGGVVWAFPWEHWAWGSAFPWKGKAIKSKTAICSFQTVQANCFSKNQTAHLSHCRRQWCQECPVGLAWAGWQGHWHI